MRVGPGHSAVTATPEPFARHARLTERRPNAFDAPYVAWYGARLERDGRRHVDKATLAASHHVRQCRMGQAAPGRQHSPRRPHVPIAHGSPPGRPCLPRTGVLDRASTSQPASAPMRSCTPCRCPRSPTIASTSTAARCCRTRRRTCSNPGASRPASTRGMPRSASCSAKTRPSPN